MRIRIDLSQLPDANRLYIRQQLERIDGTLQAATEARKARQAYLQRVKECNEHGVVALCHWSRDCDMCEATYREEIEAVPAVIDQRIEELLEGAEGPMQFWVQRMSDPFESTWRDRALEAYEDGHPHVIYG